MAYIALMFIAGCMISVQAPLNAMLGRQTGALEAALLNFVVGLAVMLVVVWFFGKGSAFKALNVPAWQWCGGLWGALMVVATTVSVPRIGALSTMVAMIAGNLAMAAVIDNFGWLGVPVTAFDWRRLLGFCLLLGGLFFIFKK